MFIFPLQCTVAVWSEGSTKIEGKETSLLVDTIAIYFSLTVGSNDKFLTKKSINLLKSTWSSKQPNVLKKFSQVFIISCI